MFPLGDHATGLFGDVAVLQRAVRVDVEFRKVALHWICRASLSRVGGTFRVAQIRPDRRLPRPGEAVNVVEHHPGRAMVGLAGEGARPWQGRVDRSE